VFLLPRAASDMDTQAEASSPAASAARTPAAARRRTVGGCEENAAIGAPPPRAWVTRRPTAWRTAPSAVSFRLGELQEGTRVAEVWTQNPYPGWVAVEPKGFLQLDDLVPASPGPCMPCMPVAATPREACKAATPLTARSARRTLEPVGQASGLLRESNVSLREEGVRLRESNVLLREEGFATRRAVAELRQELTRLREEAAAERAELAHLQRRRSCMEEKLERCCQAVSAAVEGVDRLYSSSDAVAACEGGDGSQPTPAAESSEATAAILAARAHAMALVTETSDLLADLSSEAAAAEEDAAEASGAKAEEAAEEDAAGAAEAAAEEATEKAAAGASEAVPEEAEKETLDEEAPRQEENHDACDYVGDGKENQQALICAKKDADDALARQRVPFAPRNEVVA